MRYSLLGSNVLELVLRREVLLRQMRQMLSVLGMGSLNKVGVDAGGQNHGSANVNGNLSPQLGGVLGMLLGGHVLGLVSLSAGLVDLVRTVLENLLHLLVDVSGGVSESGGSENGGGSCDSSKSKHFGDGVRSAVMEKNQAYFPQKPSGDIPRNCKKVWADDGRCDWPVKFRVRGVSFQWGNNCVALPFLFPVVIPVN